MIQLKWKNLAFFRKTNRIFLKNVQKIFSNVTPPTGPNQVSAAPPKTKEQLKVENLMKQWPEYLRNPPKGALHLEIAKEIYEDLYKYHQGDKKFQGLYDVPYNYSLKYLSNYINNKTSDSIAQYMKEFEGFLPDDIIVQKFQSLAFGCPELTKELFEVILPQVKKIIINADRQALGNVAKAIMAAANLNIADKEFWDMIVLFFSLNRNLNYLMRDFTGILA